MVKKTGEKNDIKLKSDKDYSLFHLLIFLSRKIHI